MMDVHNMVATVNSYLAAGGKPCDKDPRLEPCYRERAGPGRERGCRGGGRVAAAGETR
jgi:hypothetical protein